MPTPSIRRREAPVSSSRMTGPLRTARWSNISRALRPSERRTSPQSADLRDHAHIGKARRLIERIDERARKGELGLQWEAEAFAHLLRGLEIHPQHPLGAEPAAAFLVCRAE